VTQEVSNLRLTPCIACAEGVGQTQQGKILRAQSGVLVLAFFFKKNLKNSKVEYLTCFISSFFLVLAV
jgi:hypothetical protein